MKIVTNLQFGIGKYVICAATVCRRALRYSRKRQGGREDGTSRGAYPGWWGKSDGCFFCCLFFLFFVLPAKSASMMYEKEKRDCTAEGRAT